MPQNEHPQGWLTTAEAARRLGISPATLSRWVKRGQITPAYKAPGLRGPMYFTREAIEAA